MRIPKDTIPFSPKDTLLNLFSAKHQKEIVKMAAEQCKKFTTSG